eukprot:4174703-Pyramimonas_sp.AAC.1
MLGAGSVTAFGPLLGPRSRKGGTGRESISIASKGREHGHVNQGNGYPSPLSLSFLSSAFKRRANREALAFPRKLLPGVRDRNALQGDGGTLQGAQGTRQGLQGRSRTGRRAAGYLRAFRDLSNIEDGAKEGGSQQPSLVILH